MESSTPLVISTDSLPNEIVDEFYFVSLAVDAEGVSASWHVAAGTLPPGLTLDEDSGTIAGTPLTAWKIYTYICKLLFSK